MSDLHITRELLRAVACGELPAVVLAEIGWRHLMKLCPHCSEEVAAFQRERTPSAASDTALHVLPVVLQKQAKDMEDKIRAARRDLQEILGLEPGERIARIGRARSRFRGVTLAALLLDEAKRHMPAAPGTVYELAEVAVAVLLRTPDVSGLYDVFVRALAYRANAQRARGDLLEAASTIRKARDLMRTHGATDPLVYAEVDWIEGALAKDQRRFQEAEELLVRAVNLFALAGPKEQAAQSLLTLGLLYYDRDDFGKAIAVTRSAVDMLDPEQEPRTYLCARYNLALFLADSGNHRAAAEELQQDEALYRSFPDLWTSLRQRWLQGKIALGLGDLKGAERHLTTARTGFIAEGIGYDAAMVSLDLALVYVQEGRTGEVKHLAEEMHQIFAGGGVHREAVATLVLFQEAARQEMLSVEQIEDLADYFKRARNNPGLRFQGLWS